ncbi:MAG: hypothetical protein PWQ82_515 [Thermosediminibacterales bacterium]|nr:hypothetical protein [Thermosediminibacterales bacterium]
MVQIPLWSMVTHYKQVIDFNEAEVQIPLWSMVTREANAEYNRIESSNSSMVNGYRSSFNSVVFHHISSNSSMVNGYHQKELTCYVLFQSSNSSMVNGY